MCEIPRNDTLGNRKNKDFTLTKWQIVRFVYNAQVYVWVYSHFSRAPKYCLDKTGYKTMLQLLNSNFLLFFHFLQSIASVWNIFWRELFMENKLLDYFFNSIVCDFEYIFELDQFKLLKIEKCMKHFLYHSLTNWKIFLKY